MRDKRQMFDYEQKRRPELAALVANIDVMTEAEIRDAKVPLPWMREVLLQMKADRQADGLGRLIDQAVVDGVNPDPTGVMCQWNGAETFIKVGRTALLVSPGTLLWIDRTGMWIDTIFTAEIDPKMRGNVISKGEITRSAYYQAVRDKARQSNPTVVTTAPEGPVAGVRFFRPG